MRKCLIALAGIALITTSVRAATVSAVNGDLILGFRATGGTGGGNNLEVNLGSISNFYKGVYSSPGVTYDMTRLAILDISNTYGTDWYTRDDLYWGLAASWSTAATKDGYPKNSMWVTDTDGTLPLRKDSTTQNEAAVLITSLDNTSGGLNGRTSTANSDYSAVLLTSENNSWSTLITAGKSFSYFDPIIEGVMHTERTLYLAELETTVSGTAPGELVGTFTMSGSGLQFQAVPEPSTGMLVMLGLAMTAVVKNRRKTQG